MDGFLSWWDGVELWLSGLGFVFQTLVVMPVVLGLAYLIAVMLDGLLGRGIRLMRRARPGSDGPAPPRAGMGRASSPGGYDGPAPPRAGERRPTAPRG
jgi:hypothetical protein